MSNYERRLINDRQVANKLAMSPSWVRAQRFKRRHGLLHTFALDPVMVGASPRYTLQDVDAFIAELNPANDNSLMNKGGE